MRGQTLGQNTEFTLVQACTDVFRTWEKSHFAIAVYSLCKADNYYQGTPLEITVQVRFDGKTWFWQIVYFAFLRENKQNTPNWPGYNKTRAVAATAQGAVSTGWSGQDILSPLQTLLCSSDGVNSTQT